MEVNKPHLGVFKGMGALEALNKEKRKYFPNIRNVHNFEYTHGHAGNYLTSFSHFHKHVSDQSKFEKVSKYANQSTVVFGQEDNKNIRGMSLNRTDFSKFDYALPPKMIRHKEEGIGFGSMAESKNATELHYKTTSMEQFGGSKNLNQKQNVGYKDTRNIRFNPITGEQRSLAFGFEDFSMKANRGYKAHNPTNLIH